MTTILLWILLTLSLLDMVANIAKAGGWQPSRASVTGYTVTAVLFSLLALVTVLVIWEKL